MSSHSIATHALWLAELPGVRRDEPLARQSQYGIGGSADWFISVDDIDTMVHIVERCHSTGVPMTLLGAGSNMLVLDGGIRGLSVRLANKRWNRSGDATIEAGAATMMPRLALDLAKEGLAGMEFGIGVPGTCGASVRGNAGAFGAEVSDVLRSCRCVGPQGAHEHSTAECKFSYRDSAFKSGALRGHVVWSAVFAVRADDPVATRARTDAIQAERKASQPYGIRSLGSVFTNPPGDHAGRLIEECGLKGATSGGAQISPKHANFIVNASHATAADVLDLVRRAHDAVLEKFGVDLRCEIVIVGDSSSDETR